MQLSEWLRKAVLLALLAQLRHELATDLLDIDLGPLMPRIPMRAIPCGMEPLHGVHQCLSHVIERRDFDGTRVGDGEFITEFDDIDDQLAPVVDGDARGPRIPDMFSSVPVPMRSAAARAVGLTVEWPCPGPRE